MRKFLFFLAGLLAMSIHAIAEQAAKPTLHSLKCYGVMDQVNSELCLCSASIFPSSLEQLTCYELGIPKAESALSAYCLRKVGDFNDLEYCNRSFAPLNEAKGCLQVKNRLERLECFRERLPPDLFTFAYERHFVTNILRDAKMREFVEEELKRLADE